MQITVGDPSVIVLVGIAGCGKSTFAAGHFDAHTVVSSDQCRALVSGDPNDQSATPDAFHLLTFLLGKRLKRRRLTVIDATNLASRERARLVGQARRFDLPAVAIVLDLAFEVCLERDRTRQERTVGEEVLRRQHRTLHREMGRIDEEGFASIHVITSPDELEGLRIELQRDARLPPPPPPTDGPPWAAVFDLDGTLASNEWRVHFLEGGGKDWDAFFASMGRDAPVRPLVDLAEWLAHHVDVLIVTGRPADYEPQIRRWLADHGVVYDELFMRASGDRRPDHVAKADIYERDIAPRWDVRLLFDDREGVIDMWRRKGLYVLVAKDPALPPSPGSEPA